MVELTMRSQNLKPETLQHQDWYSESGAIRWCKLNGQSVKTGLYYRLALDDHYIADSWAAADHGEPESQSKNAAWVFLMNITMQEVIKYLPFICSLTFGLLTFLLQFCNFLLRYSTYGALHNTRCWRVAYKWVPTAWDTAMPRHSEH